MSSEPPLRDSTTERRNLPSVSCTLNPIPQGFQVSVAEKGLIRATTAGELQPNLLDGMSPPPPPPPPPEISDQFGVFEHETISPTSQGDWVIVAWLW